PNLRNGAAIVVDEQNVVARALESGREKASYRAGADDAYSQVLCLPLRYELGSLVRIHSEDMFLSWKRACSDLLRVSLQPVHDGRGQVNISRRKLRREFL